MVLPENKNVELQTTGWLFSILVRQPFYGLYDKRNE